MTKIELKDNTTGHRSNKWELSPVIPLSCLPVRKALGFLSRRALSSLPTPQRNTIEDDRDRTPRCLRADLSYTPRPDDCAPRVGPGLMAGETE